ncbi:hypothetical protein BEI_2741 [Halomonas beimenensis]|uniref:Uncharacterized protein n=2 Tax=Halomonas beimenensis TaxID=475662 RepID=A0A291PA33_9GAMM|nr:hypothetical protein BEI_2741 [Halomonas beimenensis]
MAFHDPNPKVREIERQNARLRAAFFARLFRGAWWKLRTGLLRLRFRRRRRQRRG